MSPRAFVVAVGALLTLLGGVGLVLNRLRVFEVCTASRDFYGPTETCSQSPALLIAALVLLAVGVITVVGGIVVSG